MPSQTARSGRPEATLATFSLARPRDALTPSPYNWVAARQNRPSLRWSHRSDQAWDLVLVSTMGQPSLHESGPQGRGGRIFRPTVRTLRLSDRQWRIYLAVWLVALAAVIGVGA